MVNDKLIIALDIPSVHLARHIVEQIGEDGTFYKLGFETLLNDEGWRFLEDLKSAGKKIFADLKLFDIPRTVSAAMRQLSYYNVDYVSVHGNDAILRAAASHMGNPKTLAVTALTSLDDRDLQELGFYTSIQDLVLARAKRAIEIGCAGVISSGLETSMLRSKVSDQMIIVNPGIRPGANNDDQKRVATPKEAIDNGATHIVVGRPIINADDPKKAVQNILRSIEEI